MHENENDCDENENENNKNETKNENETIKFCLETTLVSRTQHPWVLPFFLYFVHVIIIINILFVEYCRDLSEIVQLSLALSRTRTELGLL